MSQRRLDHAHAGASWGLEAPAGPDLARKARSGGLARPEGGPGADQPRLVSQPAEPADLHTLAQQAVKRAWFRPVFKP
eukprot:NODE_14890_length_334_cov_2.024561_g13726_i0.p1 GENE.NODE_14890_length_334_cov_2.024561_g13726_i0~~NODE_14890_length_334_cov_2.024561_g13726_i0.p1  ORF type:complete len:78 (+),score=2.54 NODE_14890_length_334_cov_2.024561_g13726_i0:67-300(+)